MDTKQACPSCGVMVVAGDAFCESCGAKVDSSMHHDAAVSDHTVLLKPHLDSMAAGPRMCSACGGEISDDGWCMSCGVRVAVNARHSTSVVGDWMACVSDIGRVHWRNEDAGAVCGDESHAGVAILVVCDGVSSSTDGDAAAAAAVDAAGRILSAGQDKLPTPVSERRVWWMKRLSEAGAAASDAVDGVAIAIGGDGIGDNANPPSCTFVSAILDGNLVVTGNLGDSRAYWLPDDDEPCQLTVDDSWATEQVAAGVSQQAAEADVRAHSITRWLGADAPAWQPTIATHQCGGPGWVLACSDGLWNYASSAAQVAEVFRDRQRSVGDDPRMLAEALVAFANEAGGRDNITVALARRGTAESPPAGSEGAAAPT